MGTLNKIDLLSLEAPLQGWGFAIAGVVWLAADNTKRELRRMRRRARKRLRKAGLL